MQILFARMKCGVQADGGITVRSGDGLTSPGAVLNETGGNAGEKG